MSPPNRSHGRVAVRPTLTPRALGEDEALAGGWTARVLTLFPDMFPGPLGDSLLGQALKKGLWSLQPLEVRRWAKDKHRTVDGPPAGGGPGMVMRPDIRSAAIDDARRGAGERSDWPLVYLAPRQTLRSGDGADLRPGGDHPDLRSFEGVDERALEARRVEEVSLGDFVMTGAKSPLWR